MSLQLWCLFGSNAGLLIHLSKAGGVKYMEKYNVT